MDIRLILRKCVDIMQVPNNGLKLRVKWALGYLARLGIYVELHSGIRCFDSMLHTADPHIYNSIHYLTVVPLPPVSQYQKTDSALRIYPTAPEKRNGFRRRKTLGNKTKHIQGKHLESHSGYSDSMSPQTREMVSSGINNIIVTYIEHSYKQTIPHEGHRLS